MLALITEVIENLESESSAPRCDPGDDAWFMFSDRRHVDGPDMPNNFLRISVNSTTGFGGLIWFVGENHPARGGVFDHAWISDNPNPPDFDPRVVSDPGEPAFHDPRSTLSIHEVRTAVEEFRRTGTGDRPECIRWVHGDVSGHRLDGDS
ncbi:Imm1 family immunity protein [Streptosporangium sp. H16]|uniref:Imm1 family immunity protein n=1 Tax=Streptosporangium sp. H16 TaxID=3444184 RepID=UPI003F790C11